MRQGIDPEQFWRLTPYQTRLAMGAMQDGRTILAWQIAAFSRQKKLKKLDLLIGDQKQQKGEPELKQFLMKFKGHSAQREIQ